MKQESLGIQRALDMVQNYRKEILFSLATIVLTVGCYFGFQSWRSHQNEAAHRTYESCMTVYNTPVQGASMPQADVAYSFASDDEKWSEVKKVFLEGYDQHRSSGFAGLFLVYAAEAHEHLGQKSQALDALKKAAASFSNRAMSGWYHATLGLAYTDSDEQATIDKGLKILKECAQDQKHSAYDFSLYHLGNYHWFRGEYAQAQSYWNTLEISYRNEKEPSPWYLQARQKLKLLQG